MQPTSWVRQRYACEEKLRGSTVWLAVRSALEDAVADFLRIYDGGYGSGPHKRRIASMDLANERLMLVVLPGVDGAEWRLTVSYARAGATATVSAVWEGADAPGGRAFSVRCDGEDVKILYGDCEVTAEQVSEAILRNPLFGEDPTISERSRASR